MQLKHREVFTPMTILGIKKLFIMLFIIDDRTVREKLYRPVLSPTMLKIINFSGVTGVIY